MVDLDKKEKELISRLNMLTNKAKTTNNEYSFKLEEMVNAALEIAGHENIVEKRANAKKASIASAIISCISAGMAAIMAICGAYHISAAFLVAFIVSYKISDIKDKEKKRYNQKLQEIIELDKVYQGVELKLKKLKQEYLKEFKEIEQEMKKIQKAKDVLKTISPYLGASKKNKEQEANNNFNNEEMQK
ncbi:MAG: hypothetical protein IJW25_03530 [Clostridia bacterium]|nr:hypothetical protein [Clostridia bacterium]